MKKELKLEVGKSYRNRKGVVVKIISRDPFIIEGFIFFSDEDECYQSNGRYQWEVDHPEDLTDELSPESKEMKKIIIINHLVKREKT